MQCVCVRDVLRHHSAEIRVFPRRMHRHKQRQCAVRMQNPPQHHSTQLSAAQQQTEMKRGGSRYQAQLELAIARELNRLKA
jgi:hypothetical protein